MPRRLLAAAVLLLARGATGEGPGPPECRPFCGPGRHCTNSECAACGYCKNTGVPCTSPVGSDPHPVTTPNDAYLLPCGLPHHPT